MVSRLGTAMRPDGPVRTCIGCRERAAKRELLRVVARLGETDQKWSVLPDPSGSAAGRGAHLHPSADCLALAERRRAFARALRHDAGVRGPLELAALRQHLTNPDAAPNQTAPTQNGSTSS